MPDISSISFTAGGSTNTFNFLGSGGGGAGEASALDLTPEQYEALSDAEKNNNTIYFVHDMINPDAYVASGEMELVNYQSKGTSSQKSNYVRITKIVRNGIGTPTITIYRNGILYTTIQQTVKRNDPGPYIDGTISVADQDDAVDIRSYAFYSCSSLLGVSLPACINVGEYAFCTCPSLLTADLPLCESIGQYAFQSCSSLTDVDLPLCESIGLSAFQNCVSLTSVSLPVCTTISNSAFLNCQNLTSLYLLSTSVATLGGAGAFNNTPMSKSTYTGSFGSIFVPESLVSAYKVAKNWSAYASRITAYVA